MGRATKVQRKFAAAREAEQKRQKEIRMADDEIWLINAAQRAISLSKSNLNSGNNRYQWNNLTKTGRDGQRYLKYDNAKNNRVDWIPQSSWAGIARRNLQSAQTKRNKAAASPSRSITMEQANKMTGSARKTQRGAALSAAKSAGKSMSQVTGTGSILQKAYAQTSPSIKKRISQEASLDPLNQFFTGSGKVQVSRDGQAIARDSAEGQRIQDIYDRQAAQREINKEQKKHFERVTGAKDYKEAFNIQSNVSKINPNIGTFQQVFKGGKLKETMGVKGLGDRTVTKTDFFGNPIADYNPQFLVDDTGKRIGKIDTVSRGSEFEFFQAPAKKTAVYGPPAYSSTFDFFNLGSGEKKKSDNDYLKDDEKAFAFFPDVPRGDDFFSQAGRGVVKGASNTLAGVFNIGTMVESGIRQGTGGKAIPDSEFVRFYSTPVTNVETGFFDAATGTGKSFFTGEKYDAKQRISTGFGEAYDNFFSRPVESAGSLVELVPYFGYGAAKTGVRAAGDFFGSLGKTTTKGTKATGPQKTGNFAQDFFYTKPDKKTIFDLDTASVFSRKNIDAGSGITKFFGDSGSAARTTLKKTGPSDFFKATAKTKGGGTYVKKSWTDDFMGGKQIKSGSSFLIQKTKQKVKTKQQTKNKLDQFFKPLQKQKTKTKQKPKVKQDYFVAFMPKVGQKQKSKQESMLIPKQTQKQKQKQDFFAGTALKTGPKTTTPTKLKVIGGAGWWAFWGGGARGSKKKRNKRGDKSFTAWNVDESKVGSFFGGPSYRTSKSTRVFKDADAKNKKAAGKRRKKNKDFVSDFFG